MIDRVSYFRLRASGTWNRCASYFWASGWHHSQTDDATATREDEPLDGFGSDTNVRGEPEAELVGVAASHQGHGSASLYCVVMSKRTPSDPSLPTRTPRIWCRYQQFVNALQTTAMSSPWEDNVLASEVHVDAS